MLGGDYLKKWKKLFQKFACVEPEFDAVGNDCKFSDVLEKNGYLFLRERGNQAKPRSSIDISLYWREKTLLLVK